MFFTTRCEDPPRLHPSPSSVYLALWYIPTNLATHTSVAGASQIYIFLKFIVIAPKCCHSDASAVFTCVHTLHLPFFFLCFFFFCLNRRHPWLRPPTAGGRYNQTHRASLLRTNQDEWCAVEPVAFVSGWKGTTPGQTRYDWDYMKRVRIWCQIPCNIYYIVRCMLTGSGWGGRWVEVERWNSVCRVSFLHSTMSVWATLITLLIFEKVRWVGSNSQQSTSDVRSVRDGRW